MPPIDFFILFAQETFLKPVAAAHMIKMSMGTYNHQRFVCNLPDSSRDIRKTIGCIDKQSLLVPDQKITVYVYAKQLFGKPVRFIIDSVNNCFLHLMLPFLPSWLLQSYDTRK